MEQKNDMLITISPQVHDTASTKKIMWTVVLCLLPAGIWGVYIFGVKALIVTIVSILAALAAEAIMGILLKRSTLSDGSAFLTGLLIGFNMPPAVPLFIPVIASFFAIIVVKWSFGGLGTNWMNPALAGRVFVFFSWTGPMTNWTFPRTISGADTVSGASPLGFVKTGLMDFTGKAQNSMDFMIQNNYPQSPMGFKIAEWFSGIGININGGYIDLFLGNIPGCIGEVSAFLLLAGAVYLFIKKIITWEIPVAYLGSFILLVWGFGGLRFGNGFFTGDIIFNLFTGGLILGVFFMATDMVTSPLTRKGMIIYGIGAGFLTFLIRFYGSFPEGVSLAIILMNIFVPMINRYTKPKRFGLQIKGKSK